MKIQTAGFVCSSPDIKLCPPSIYPEYAFCGRSNVGKSSLINMLTSTKGLAKTSSTPGKTILINHFIVNESWYLADLPGYGYARVSKTEKSTWRKMINDYLLQRENLMCLFLLIDSRLEPQTNDLGFINWLAEHEIPFVIAFTKCDKLTSNERKKNFAVYKKELEKSWEELPVHFFTSAEKNEGRTEMLEFIGKSNLLFKKKHPQSNS